MTHESVANILIVDDDARTLTAMESLLAGPGRRIVCVRSGNDALRCLLREDFALILLDVRLPDINGFEAAKLIRGSERLRNIPIIFLSAIDTLEEDVFKGAASGAVDYLFKPVVPQVLQGKVSVFINLYHMSEQLKRRAVHESEERFRLVVESIQDYAVFLLDPSGNITMSNSASERIRGWKVPEILGQSFAVFFTAADRTAGRPREILMRTAVDGRYQEEAWCTRKDGSAFWAEVIYARVLDDAGRLVGFSGVARDLTEHKRAERELQRLNTELEARVAERTAELLSSIEQREKLQQQLLQSQKMESIGALAAGVAHDFNNLLNVIASYASVLKKFEGAVPDSIAQSASVITETVERGAFLVQQLMAMGRRTDARFEALQLNEVIAKLETILNETFPKTIVTSLILDSELPRINGNAQQINQALLNLCVNARDAIGTSGSIVICTETVMGGDVRQRFQEAKEDRYACISVSDSGCGMDAASQARIFEPFFTTKEGSHGTGLGLSVVYGIVRSHAGFIDVESAPGAGTTFRIYLPLADESPESTSKTDLLTERSQPAGGGETILFVDDEENQLQLMRRFLESEGYKVSAAKDGAEAVELFLKNKDTIDLAVLDVRLPKLNGWEAFQRMREVRPEIRALFATGLLSPEMEAEIAREKLGGVILKPYKLDVVLQKIAEVLRMVPGAAGGRG
ncbi:MAG TPA: response regulator [Candidatus Binatia bacterium]|nr:response regulator [Candidatus Binatia bacterium]